MRLLLLTNMAAYQQVELADALVGELGENNFRLGILGELSDKRRQMGWADQNEQPYLLRFNASSAERAELLDWIHTADVVIQGRFPIKHLRARIRSGKLTYAYQERVWKKGFSIAKVIARIPFLIKHYYSVNRSNYHLLAAGRYAAPDLMRLGIFRHRAWKFGYFIAAKPWVHKPEIIPLHVIWCGRLMELKRPQRVLQFIAQLNNAGIEVRGTVIGDGDLRQPLEAQAAQLGIQQCVQFLGWQSVEQVNDAMQSAHVALMTSDHREGWGVVINEAINNGCFPIVCDDVGSARWLIKDKVTGIVYQDADFAAMTAQFIADFRRDPNFVVEQAQLGNQYLSDHWSAGAAAKRVIEHARWLRTEASNDLPYQSGPCSRAT